MAYCYIIQATNNLALDIRLFIIVWQWQLTSIAVFIIFSGEEPLYYFFVLKIMFKLKF